MKKYLLSLAVALMAVIGFTACSSSDDGIDPTPEPIPDSPYAHQTFTVTALDAGAVVDLKAIPYGFIPDYSVSNVKLVYSTDKVKWEDYKLGTKLTLAKAGDNVYFKAGTKSNPDVQNSTLYSVKPGESFRYNNVTLEASKRINVSGNILSLLYGDKAQRTLKGDAEHEFSFLFSKCKTLVDASNLILPTNVSNYTFQFAFDGCSSLVSAPQLPATKMAELCYTNMFEVCTSLKEAPELPAKELAEQCYNMMFYKCSALVKAPKLPATKMAKLCYANMFLECTSLTEAPVLPAKDLAEGCYTSMFEYCYALKEAPKLPATTLAKSCYSFMFVRCNSLKKTPDLPATKLVESCYQTMFSGCDNLETATTLAAPDATVKNAYSSMFSYCPMLNHVEMRATKVSEDCLDNFILDAGISATTPPVLYVAKGMKSDPIIAAMEGLTWTVKEK